MEGELELAAAESAVESAMETESVLEKDHCTVPGSLQHKLRKSLLGTSLCMNSAILQDTRVLSAERCPDWLPLATTRQSCPSCLV